MNPCRNEHDYACGVFSRYVCDDCHQVVASGVFIISLKLTHKKAEDVIKIFKLYNHLRDLGGYDVEKAKAYLEYCGSEEDPEKVGEVERELRRRMIEKTGIDPQRRHAEELYATDRGFLNYLLERLGSSGNVNKYAESLSYAEEAPDSVRESFTKEEVSWALKKNLEHLLRREIIFWEDLA